MTAFDRYVARLRQRAGISLSAEAERELRAHFDEAVAAHLAAGQSGPEAELAALAALGRPEVVARAFRRERRVLWRLAGGPTGALAPLWAHRRRLLIVIAAAALLGAGVGRLLPPSYDAYAPVAVWATHYRTDQPTALPSIIERFQEDTGLQVRTAHDLGELKARGSASDPADAVAKAKAAASRAEAAFDSIIAATPDRSGASYLVAPVSLHVSGGHPIGTATAAGGVLGLLVGSALTLRGQRRRAGSR